jgi:hypothetical protein
MMLYERFFVELTVKRYALSPTPVRGDTWTFVPAADLPMTVASEVPWAFDAQAADLELAYAKMTLSTLTTAPVALAFPKFPNVVR